MVFFMLRTPKIVTLSVLCALFAATPVLACHSDYFNEMFVKIKGLRDSGSLEKDQIASLWNMKANFDKIQQQYGRAGKPSRALNPHVASFVAAAAGVLDGELFTQVTGKKKTEVQELRYEVNQLKKELAELKQILKEIKASQK